MFQVNSHFGLSHRVCALEHKSHGREGVLFYMLHQSLVDLWALTSQSRLLQSVEHNSLGKEGKYDSLALNQQVVDRYLLFFPRLENYVKGVTRTSTWRIGRHWKGGQVTHHGVDVIKVFFEVKYTSFWIPRDYLLAVRSQKGTYYLQTLIFIISKPRNDNN